MAARKAVPAEEKVSQHLTVNLTPVEMDALKQLAKEDKRSVNSLVKAILAKEIQKRADAKKSYFVFISWSKRLMEMSDDKLASTLDEVRTIANEAITKGAVRVTVKRRGGGTIDIWTVEDGWLDGRIAPRGKA